MRELGSKPTGGTFSPDEPFIDEFGMGRVRSVESPGVRPADAQQVGVVAGSAEHMPRRLSFYTRKAVETSAEAAARDNRTPLDACPYRIDFAPLEHAHWMACFFWAGGTINPKE